MTFKICRSIDLETTDLPENGGRVCEIGWYDISDEDGVFTMADTPEATLINPQMEMPPGARSVHHISDEMLVDASTDVKTIVGDVLIAADVLIAHQAKFEQAFIITTKPWICTYKVARHLYPHLDSFSLQYLRYNFDLALDHDLAMPPHRAAPDAYVAGRLFALFLGKMTVQEMIDVSELPVLLYRCDFGKHEGKIWEDIASLAPDYLQWILRQDFDEEVMHTAAYWLKRGG